VLHAGKEATGAPRMLSFLPFFGLAGGSGEKPSVHVQGFAH